MKQLFPRIALGLLLAGAWVPTARACINDREVNAAEREFKSSYQDRSTPAPSPYPHEGPVTPLALMGIGGSLLVSSFPEICYVPSRWIFS
jgi:hypothetical protein